MRPLARGKKMALFQSDSDISSKAHKRIAELKAELASLTGKTSWSDIDMADITDTIKEKGHQALDCVSEHASNVKEKAKENPKTSLAVVIGLSLAAYLLLRKL